MLAIAQSLAGGGYGNNGSQGLMAAVQREQRPQNARLKCPQPSQRGLSLMEVLAQLFRECPAHACRTIPRKLFMASVAPNLRLGA